MSDGIKFQAIYVPTFFNVYLTSIYYEGSQNNQAACLCKSVCCLRPQEDTYNSMAVKSFDLKIKHTSNEKEETGQQRLQQLLPDTDYAFNLTCIYDEAEKRGEEEDIMTNKKRKKKDEKKEAQCKAIHKYVGFLICTPSFDAFGHDFFLTAICLHSFSF